MNEYMKLAIEQAQKGVENNEGGPFGCVILDKNNNILSVANNMVLVNNDPTAHAEIIAIRKACTKLNTYDLSDCILYTTCEPCPMCLSAIIWANIKQVYYACNKDDANKIGFRDDIIYNFLENRDIKLLDMKNIDRNACLKLFDEYKSVIY